MLSNIKDFFSVVQDGLVSNSNLRQTLQEVQKVRHIFTEKQKPIAETKVNYGAGGELLEKNQEYWSELHQNADHNALAADKVDKQILQIHNLAKSRLQSASELAHNLAYLPQVAATVAQCMDSLKHIQELIQTVEEELVDLEDAAERCKMEKWKLDHHYNLSLYKESKLASLEQCRRSLVSEGARRDAERERRRLAALQARRELSAAAFGRDLARYRATGEVPAVPSSPPEITLEQINLEDDKTDLEDFLKS